MKRSVAALAYIGVCVIAFSAATWPTGAIAVVVVALFVGFAISLGYLISEWMH